MSINVHIRFVLWTFGGLKIVSLFLQAHLHLCGHSQLAKFFGKTMSIALLQIFNTRIGCWIDRKSALEVRWGQNSFTYAGVLQTQWWMDVKKVHRLTPARFLCSFSTTMPFENMKSFFVWNKFPHVSKFSKFNFFCFFPETIEPKTISPKTI